MVDTWQPAEQEVSISTERLSIIVSLIGGQESIQEDIKSLDKSDVEWVNGLLHSPQSAWLEAIKGFNDEDVLKLCMLFTVGEMEYPTWAFGSKNPTIYFLRHLKYENRAAEKDFVRWLKKQTDNRYIPYGPALI